MSDNIEHFDSVDAIQKRAVDLWGQGFVVLQAVQGDGEAQIWEGYSAFKEENGEETKHLLLFREGVDITGADPKAIYASLSPR